MVRSLVCNPIITVPRELLGLSLNNIIILMTIMKVNESQGQGYLTREDFNSTGKHTNLALRHIYVFVFREFE